MLEGKQVEAGFGVFEHLFGGIEEAQALEVLMDGHAGVLFEDAAQMIRRKVDG